MLPILEWPQSAPKDKLKAPAGVRNGIKTKYYRCSRSVCEKASQDAESIRELCVSVVVASSVCTRREMM